jgi:processive 1,2-diacylglycerol beta-glucosyltransferase
VPEPRPPSILCLLNGPHRKAPRLIERLIRRRDWKVTFVTDDLELEALALEKTAEDGRHVRVIHAPRESWDLQFTGHDIAVTAPQFDLVSAARAAECPLVYHAPRSADEETMADHLRRAQAGVEAGRPREIIAWLERGLQGDRMLQELWRRNFMTLPLFATGSRLVRLPTASGPDMRRPLLCDFHTHTTWSDGRLSVPQLVDFYGQRGFDCLCITDHLCDPKRLLGKLVNLTGLVIPPAEIETYFEEIAREKARALERYGLLLMTGVEFNKDGYTAKSSTHLLGIDLRRPIDPSLSLPELISAIQDQDGLAVASHPHETKSVWGRDTLYLWEHVEKFAPLLDAWEVANRDDIFNPIGLKKLPFLANSDLHKPKHIHSWKTVLYCEKTPEAIKRCIRVNRDVSLTLYRGERFGQREMQMPAVRETPEMAQKLG